MGVFDSLSTGLATVRRNPIVVGIVFAYSLLSSALVALRLVDPLLVLPAYLVVLAVLPFYVGGLIGAIHEGLDGRTSVGRFVEAGRSSYLSLLGGGVVLFFLSFVSYVVALVVGVVSSLVIFGAVGLGGVSGIEGASAVMFVVLVLVVLFELALLYLPVFVLQFFPAAVVVDGLGFVDSFKRSAALLRNNFLSVLGFDAVAFLFGLLLNVPTGYLVYLAFENSSAIAAGDGVRPALDDRTRRVRRRDGRPRYPRRDRRPGVLRRLLRPAFPECRLIRAGPCRGSGRSRATGR